MLTRVFSAAIQGVDAVEVEVEINAGSGAPQVMIIEPVLTFATKLVSSPSSTRESMSITCPANLFVKCASALLAIALVITPLRAKEALDEASIVLSGPESMAIFDQKSRKGPAGVEGTWTPTPDQIDAMWKALPDFLNRPPSVLQKPLDMYHRQYVGFLRGGRRFIYLNAFRWHEAWETTWKVRPIVVFDGGSGFFGVEYDVEGEKLLNFEYNNGYAASYPSRKE